MAKVTIDGIVIDIANGSSVIQACEAAGREIPHFCYHEKLSIAGNCRMCLVEVEKAPKPVASCAYPVADGMVVHTDSEMVRRARRGVMEFLLINHPLDCPICDQGGECDLQDQSVSYGMDRSRYMEEKRAVRDKDFGPLVKTVMTRCIQCTRCVRFATEIAGVPDLGATSRGESIEIGTYVEHALGSELSGNMIDLCPVGALTSKPYAFVARPWELRHTDGIDVTDATGTPVQISSRGAEVLRITPRADDAINEGWLSDKGRFAQDGLKRRRLDRPWVRRDGVLKPASWAEAFGVIADRMRGAGAGGITGDLCDAESMFALREMLGAANVCGRQDGAATDVSHRAFYTFGSIAAIEDADAILLIGTNPRREAPVVNARIRKRWLAGPLPVALIGPRADLTYDYDWLGDTPAALADLADGRHEFLQTLRGAKRPMVVVGAGALARADGGAVLANAGTLLRPDVVSVLQHAAARVAALDLGLRATLADALEHEVIWLLGADELDAAAIGPEKFVVYQGHHGDRGAARADVILPGAAYTEKDGTYVNTEGRVQRAFAAVSPPGEARADWAILRAASAAIGAPLPFDTLDALRSRMMEANPLFRDIGGIRRTLPAAGPRGGGSMSDAPFTEALADHWRTDPVSRASATMARCSALRNAALTDAAPILMAAE